jgi:hypothetical protein
VLLELRDVEPDRHVLNLLTGARFAGCAAILYLRVRLAAIEVIDVDDGNA